MLCPKLSIAGSNYEFVNTKLEAFCLSKLNFQFEHPIRAYCMIIQYDHIEWITSMINLFEQPVY